MGKIKSNFISTNGKEVFRPGETVSGTVTLDVEDEIQIKGLKISCMGQGLTKWSSRRGRWYDDDIGKESYLNSYINLLSGDVLAHLNINESAYLPPVKGESKKTLSKALGIGDAGTLFLSASINRTGYCPGEEIAIILKARNESTKNLGFVQASLVQNVNYIAAGESDSTVKRIRTIQDRKLEKGTTREWADQKLLIDPVPPSSKMLTSHIIKVTYHVLIEVEISFGINLELRLPIKIGTCPFGLNLPSQPSLSSPGHYVIDKSNKINYRKCTYGVVKPNISDGSFVNIAYTPMTAFATTSSASGASAVPPVKATSVSSKAQPASSPKAVTNQSTTASKKAQEATAPKVVTGTQVPRPANPTQPPTSSHRTLPTAPPLPPTYEEACVGAMSTVPKPLFMQPDAGKGSILCFLFPPTEIDYVKNCFKSNIPNLLLHSGKILAFSSELDVIPSHQTAAIFIHFGAQRTSLSWLQNMISFDSSLTSKCWVVIAENKVNLGFPGDYTRYGALSLSILKRNADFKPDKAFTDEFTKLTKESLRPIKQRHGGKSIVSGKVILACGDWSNLPAKANELTLTMNQWPALENAFAYKEEFTTDPSLIRYLELVRSCYTNVANVRFPVGDISMFEN